MKEFNIAVEDASTEGILWLKVTSKLTNTEMHACVCYLPPQESTRNIDANEFFDELICQTHQYCKDAMFFICGDFNARCSNFKDYIEGVDDIPDRHVIDFTSNKYGEIFCDFMINANCCMLNGRNSENNEYTCIRPQGMSVVDYCLVPYEDFDKYSDFKIQKITNLLTETKIIQSLEPRTSIPDHSILIWTTKIDCIHSVTESYNHKNQYEFTKFSRDIPNNFLNDRIAEVEDLIAKLESNVRNQTDLDNKYDDFISLIINEMYRKVNHKKIKIKEGQSNKKRRLRKPWWSNELSAIWNELCLKEKAVTKAEGNKKRPKRELFLRQRKLFNREVQRAKRSYWRKRQLEIAQLETSDQKAFWKEIGKIGIAQERRNQIPMEVLLESGEVSTDPKHVLQTWKTSYEQLLNQNAETATPPDISDEQQNVNSTNLINNEIGIEEVKTAIKTLKSNKAMGIDELPSEVLRCEHLLKPLHTLFNKCFSSGVIPSLWKQGIINPVPKLSTSDRRDPLSYRGITLTTSVYKLYCSILNTRLSKWEEEYSILADNQNGFRKTPEHY